MSSRFREQRLKQAAAFFDQGCTVSEVAWRLSVSERTVQRYQRELRGAGAVSPDGFRPGDKVVFAANPYTLPDRVWTVESVNSMYAVIVRGSVRKSGVSLFRLSYADSHG